MSTDLREATERLIRYALTLPGAWEDSPWGERVVKVNKKVFAFMGLAEEMDRRLFLGVKLPSSRGYALSLPFAEPMNYGLGKHGWVTLQFAPGDEPPIDLLQEWIAESYRAVAPKRLVAQLDAGVPNRDA